MSMQPDIVSEAELAKNSVVNSPLNEDVKRNLVTLITKSTMATNGITKEEKVQALTECMASLANVLASYMSKAEEKLQNLENMYLSEHPQTKLESLKKREHDLFEVEQYRHENGIKPGIRVNNQDIITAVKQGLIQAQEIQKKENKENKEDMTWVERIWCILDKGYFWAFAAVAVCSPYAADTIRTIISCFVK